MSRKRSIVSSFGELSSSVAPLSVQVPRVSAGVIGATQRTLTEIREERDRLAERVASGGWLELEASVVDPSPFPDRLPDDDLAPFEAFKQSISEEGQKVPVEVRPHPTIAGRFQLVYGHRRWRAAAELGIKLKAIVVNLSDHDLVLTQGLENSARQDLTWIEKAVFAFRMERSGIRARDIRAALLVDDAELARFRAVCQTIGEDVLRQIGRAPKIGRPRWGALTAIVTKQPAHLDTIRMTLAAAKGRTSVERFTLCMAAISSSSDLTPRPALSLERANGSTFGKVFFGRQTIQIELESAEASEFRAFFETSLSELVERFRQRQRNH